ncbi:hypothetical protein RND81_01G060700 [Saponaria officinalis]|uniref:Retrotransposon gag domain-containing protein n=1 Tax=Saponaria officinalis TaxID=3572 RepID=A0AAW1NDC6_SAPOF
MTVGGSSIEEQMMEMKKLFEKVMKDSEEKNKNIAELQKEVVELRNKDANRILNGTDTEEDDKEDDDETNAEDKSELIANAIKSQLGGKASGNARYNKPYTRRIDSLHMPLGYQPPKFQQFDEKGNPKQHIAHFVETCNNAGTDGDLLVKQFVRSLKGIAFDWYTDLDPESIDSWNSMEDEFLNRFYSTRRIVSMSELTNTTQWEEEPVIDYISRWRALSLECKDRLSEASAVEMCMNGMNWDLLYILNGIKPRSFQELATPAHDMEITIKARNKGRTSSSKAPVEKKEFKKFDRSSKTSSKESMTVSTSSAPLQEKKYPFPDSDLSGMLDDLLENNVIQLPESKRPEQANRTTDPNYCRYHRLVSHPIEKCITLKEKIMQLAKDEKIILDLDETVTTNQTTATLEQPDAEVTENGIYVKRDGWHICMVQFGSLEPVAVWVKETVFSPPATLGNASATLESVEDMDDDEGWTLDLLLGSNPHNRPLYVLGYIRGHKVKRILIDGGSWVNLMPKTTMDELGITMDELYSSRTVIHETLFHIMEGKSSFKLLLGRPWMHENGVVTSTLHQCLKYFRGGERRINGDAKSFTKAGSFFADAKFYKENGTSSEFMPTIISSTGKGGKTKKVVQRVEETTPTISINNAVSLDDTSYAQSKADQLCKLVVQPTRKEQKQVATSPVLRYIPKSRRKEGESPFAECQQSKGEHKDEKKGKKVIKQEWVAKVTTPLSNTMQTKIMKPPIKGFVPKSTNPSNVQNKGVFNSNAYKLLAHAGYDFDNPTPLGSVIEVEPYGLNKDQRQLFKREGSFKATKVGLGYESPAPVKLTVRRKKNVASSQYITDEENRTIC